MGHCEWVFGVSEADRAYHETEWGIPVHNDDRHMFEHLTLECLQCGLSWGLMMKKREIFRQCFENFEYDKIAVYTEDDVQRILSTEGMLRSERKVRAVIMPAAIRRSGRSLAASVLIFGAIQTGKRSCTTVMHRALCRSATACPTGSART